MTRTKKIIIIFSWFLSILIAIIWTFENSDKIQTLKDIIKNEKVNQKKEK